MDDRGRNQKRAGLLQPPESAGLDRRGFIRLTAGAGAALATGMGFSGCRRTEERLSNLPGPDPWERELAL
ncbi:MAG: twin-arginine translocation signal domain-containing protein, partial [Acidobacteriota bacterium]